MDWELSMLINWNFVIRGWIFKLQQKLKLGKDFIKKRSKSIPRYHCLD
jgi:hypothetical protein